MNDYCTAKIVGYMNVHSSQRYVVYEHKKHISPTIQAAAGTGGGQMPFIVVIK